MNLVNFTPFKSQNVLNSNSKVSDKTVVKPDDVVHSDVTAADPREVVGRSMVSFQGRIPLLDKLDMKLLENLAEEFKLPKDKLKGLQESVVNFLKENKLKSLGEIDGEENFDADMEIHSLIREYLEKHSSYKDSDRDYLASELVNRCDLGDDYVPQTKAEFLKGYNSFANLIKVAINNSGEKKFVNAISYIFELPKESTQKAEKIITDFMKENNLKSLRELEADEGMNLQAVLFERLTKDLDLSDTESDLLGIELSNWIYSEAGHYKPMISKLDMGVDAFNHACDKLNLDDAVRKDLFWAMKDEAAAFGYKNIFECFHKNPDFASSEVSRILDSIENSEIRTNLSIELASYADDARRAALNLPKHAATEAFYDGIADDVASDALKKEFSLSRDVLKEIKAQITSRHPEYISGGEGKSTEQIAFEIADKYSLPSGAEKTIKNILSETDNMSPEELDFYMMNKLLGGDLN